MKKILSLFLAGITTLGVTTLAVAQKKSNPSRECVSSPPSPPVFYEKTKTRNHEVYTSDNRMQGIANERDHHGATFRGLDDSGFRKHVKYNSATGELFLQYHFKKNDEEYVYEKTVNAADKSEAERQGIIDQFEKEIELPRDETEM